MKKILIAVGLLNFLNLLNGAEPLEVGAKVPEITATDQDGKSINLAEIWKKGLTLVYFYPKADTPGCTAEACSLRDAFVELTEKGVTVVGVSSDKPEAQKAFKAKYHLPFTLIGDSDRKVIQAFGVTTIPVVGVASRQSFLIRNGIVIWRDLQASTHQQASDVLKVIKSNQNK